MRLNKIKIIGFKSFVDPTLLQFPTNRTGIVGPNGCGKSNVIDAVRWVMGELSAKNLRGGAMSDVIFNGAATRKPADTASVELIFGEVDLPQFAGTSELSVKREIMRNGQSDYYLNHIPCRRKDITDLFLGTGMGPRSYAIIEQGMISRLVEAKPEEMRIFLEEAAGISKYKDRRKETEQRMKQTRENLARLNEVRHELQKQLDKLQRQAKQAEKYQQLQQQLKIFKAQLLALRWFDLDQATQIEQQTIAEKDEQLQIDTTHLDNLEEQHKTQQETRLLAQKTLETAQTRLFRLENDMSRLEQTLAHHHERQEQLEWDIQQLDQAVEEAKTHLNMDQQQAAELVAQLEHIEQQQEETASRAAEAQAAFETAESELHTWQQAWDSFNQRAAEPAQRAQVERAREQNLTQRLQQNQQRLQRLQEEARQLSDQTLVAEMKALQAQIEECNAILSDQENALTTAQQAVFHLRECVQQQSSQLHDYQTQSTQLTGRLASLETLQEAALGKNNAALLAWLQAYGLKNAPLLAQSLTVAAGWERAVEVILEAHLQAICVADLTALQAGLQQLPTGRLSLFETATRFHTSENPLQSIHSITGWATLAAKVQTDLPIAGLLARVWVADSLAEALTQRIHLQADESVITPQGVWLGNNWIRSQQGVDEKAGLLAREQEIQQVARQVTRFDELIQTLAAELEDNRHALRTVEQKRDNFQHQVNEIKQQLSQIQSQYEVKRTRYEHFRVQSQRINEETAELKQYLEEDGEALEITRQTLHEALDLMNTFADEREELTQKRDRLQTQLQHTRQAWQSAKDQHHQWLIKSESIRTDTNRLQQSIQRAELRVAQLIEQRFDLEKVLQKQNIHTDLEEQLEILRTQRGEAEEALLHARQTVEHLESALTHYDQERQRIENRHKQVRMELEQLRLNYQTNHVRKQGLEEELSSLNYSPVALLAELPEQANETTWQAEIITTQQKLDKLGAVNLAALEEFSEQSERKTYLDTQADDLNSGLEQLDNAIRTIDRETRTRLKQTFDNVNVRLQALFPRLFNGGQAYLELTDSDILKAGVAIMARPPGKRNTTIHLLSGGEKTLTAIALVFAFFELNPAPFCLLDEVDAPLDDTNVGRFCNLLDAMSEKLQFIFISHNKMAMEIADQLVGITMQEAGVSRPVTVDVNTAVNMVK